MTFFEQDEPTLGAPRVRSRRRGIGGSTVVMFLGLGLLAAVMVPVGLGALDRTPADAVFESPAPIDEVSPQPPLVGESAALADRMFLTDQGRELFARTQPQLVDVEEIGEVCADATHEQPEDWSMRGCFLLGRGSPPPGRIFVYHSGDERLRDAMVTIAAHELLHAVYASMPVDERPPIDALIAVEVARVQGDDPVHAQITASAGEDDDNLPTERFAYLGSQIALEEGFDPELEKIYAEIFTDRSALVDAHQRSLKAVDEVLESVKTAWAEVTAKEQSNAQTRAQLEADRAAYDKAAAAYEADRAKFEATPADEQQRWKVTLTPKGGEPRTMSWQDSLTYRHDELERYRADIGSRSSALAEAETTAAALRKSAEARKADAVALLRAANPGVSIPDL